MFGFRVEGFLGFEGVRGLGFFALRLGVLAFGVFFGGSALFGS